MDCLTRATVWARAACSQQPWLCVWDVPGMLPGVGQDTTSLAAAALDGYSSVRSKAHLQELSSVCVAVPAAGSVLSKGLWVLSCGVWNHLCSTGGFVCLKIS